MNSRERLIATINHRQPDRVVLDFGGTPQTGMHASVLYQFRKALGLEERPVTIAEPTQMIGVIEEDVRKALQADVVGLWNPFNLLGVKDTDWKPWTMPDGTPVLMAGGMGISRKDGYIYLHPQGDLSAEPSMRMPDNGYFFDNITRGGEFDEDNLSAKKDYKDDFSLLTDEVLRHTEAEADRLYGETEYGVVGQCDVASFGNMFLLPGAWLRGRPKGIRKSEDWLMAHVLYPDYIFELFETQLEFAVKNLELYKQAVGDKIQVVLIGTTDFGAQNGPIISVEDYRKYYKPFHKKVNDWVHKNTNWKTYYHNCGSLVLLLDDFYEAGLDILNPVQCSAAGMDPVMLKEKYGEKFVFWGGGVDAQTVLTHGTPEEVKAQVKERLKIFSKGGGYVFSSVHNIVPKTPAENALAVFEAFSEFALLRP